MVPSAEGGPGRPLLGSSLLIRVLGGVAAAVKAPADEVEKTQKWLHQIGAGNGPTGTPDNGNRSSAETLESWMRALSKWHTGDSAVALGLAKLTVAVAALREHSRHDIPMEGSRLSTIWNIVYEALNIPCLQETWAPSRSAQGFLALPLCSITKNGRIDELFRLHVWLPDGKRGNPKFSVHSHQPFAHSWILAGEGRDHQYEAREADIADDATHEAFGLSWNYGGGLSRAYSAHQQSSAVEPTGRRFCVSEIGSDLHRRNDTYTIPAGAFHSSDISPEVLHATLFYFDSSRGFVQDAPVLGPVDGEPFTQLRDPAGESARSLASHVQHVRSWEQYMDEGRQHASRAEWEHAMRAFNNASRLCESPDAVMGMRRYRGLALGELGTTNRRFGRYAEGFLKQACLELEGFPEYSIFHGELGVVYRHMGRLEEARDAFQAQYASAKDLHLDLEACRAIGNLGMVNYQLSQGSGSDELLLVAANQLQERVDRCNSIRENILASERDPPVQRLRQLDVWAAIGLSRLSLCCAARGNIEEACRAAAGALEHAKKTGDPTVVAISRFFHGRLLAAKGQHKEAMAQFNTSDGCTPAIAFCKEPSQEHRGYLEYLVDAGADMDLVDDQGYKALDYAVFNGDEPCQDLVLRGLRHQFSSESNLEELLRRRLREAKLRKGYRDVFQQKLRPVLLAGGDGCIGKLRVAYADAVAADAGVGEMFDRLKVVPYGELLRFGRLPRSSDRLFRELGTSKEADRRQFVIFFSYRWLNPMAVPSGGRADDEKHTQYRRMLGAIESFLASHKDVSPEHLLIWVVSIMTLHPRHSPRRPVFLLTMLVGLCLRGPGQSLERCGRSPHDPGPVRCCRQPHRRPILRESLVLRRGHDDQHVTELVWRPPVV